MHLLQKAKRVMQAIWTARLGMAHFRRELRADVRRDLQGGRFMQ
jgi:hypothetical protein